MAHEGTADHRVGQGWQRAFRAIGVLKWSAFWALLIALLPVPAPWVPVFAGIFGDLTFLGLTMSLTALFAASLSALYVAGMQVIGVGTRVRADGGDYRHRSGYLPRWVQRAFDVPMTGAQVGLALLLTVPPACAMGVLADTAYPLLAWLLAAVIATTVGMLLAVPWRLASPDPSFVPRQALTRWLTGVARRSVVVPWLVRRLQRALAYVVPSSLCITVDGKERIAPEHGLSLVAASATLLVLLLLARFAEPPYAGDDLVLEAPFLLYVLLTLLVWLFGALEYHLARYGVPPLLAVSLLLASGYGLGRRTTATFAVVPDPAKPPLRAVAVAAPARDNLVVVCSTGGGILAAGWTALALQRLLEGEDPIVRQAELRLISAVSGGSVGAAFFLHGMLAERPDLAAISAAAVHPSLQAVTYGLVYPDLVRALTAGASSAIWSSGRGQYLEQQWQATAEAALDGRVVPWRLHELIPAIERGDIPAPIFNATAMETGRRVMLTPIDFVAHAERDDLSATLTDYYLGGASAVELDTSIWTAARMSATFPYLTPAAFPNLEASAGASNRRGHHLVDGGYYDNYGVASAVDWLELVLAARERGDAALEFRQVAIVQLRAFPISLPGEVPPASDFTAELLGPLIGVTRIRDGAAYSRNEVELQRFEDHWNRRLQHRQVQVRSFVFAPDRSANGPLNWRMTRQQADDMRQRWDGGAGIRAASAALSAFLGAGRIR
ncbi:MAG: hypothetical protein AAF628_16880 [Planctomycetota bacterium]